VGIDNKRKLAILSSLLVISLIPITIFFAVDYTRAEVFIRGLLTGHAGISVNISKDWFDIYSTVFFGSIRFSLTYVIMLLTSMVVSLISLALIAKNLYSRHKSTKNGGIAFSVKAAP
jgi:phosphoglycerol transferase MdoB-like AlkP superfamily enzyme